VWSTLGQNAAGAFEEALSLDGRRIVSARRARVQARQIQVYTEAGRLGWSGPWRPVVDRGMDYLRAHYLDQRGLMRASLTAEGEPLDNATMVYDQAFLIFALACLSNAIDDPVLEEEAMVVREALLERIDVWGGVVESGPYPYQSNAHMHLLEAALAWEEASGCSSWLKFSDDIVRLAREKFIDSKTGSLRELFADDWSPAVGDDGSLVEPGHQFEWAWLLSRYSRKRSDPQALNRAWRLYEAGLQGVDQRRGTVVDAMSIDGAVRSARSRLWPQTEWLKAALILAPTGDEKQRQDCLNHASKAQKAIWRYLTPQGLWRDKLLESGEFLDEPSPASSFYHIMAAYSQVQATAGDLILKESNPLSLA